MARMPIKTLAVIASALCAFGFVLDGQRLEDHTPVFTIDHEMDARLTAYVPLVRAGSASYKMTDAELLALAARWSDGRRSGRLRDPMPARYGGIDGARAELVTEAIRLSGVVAARARRHSDKAQVRALFRASVEPLRAVQYADVSTLAKIQTRRRWISLAIVESGLGAEEAARTTDPLRTNHESLDALLRHVARLRNQFRVRFEDEQTLWNADPFFERLITGETNPDIFARR